MMNTRIGDAQNYLDLNGLNDIRLQSKQTNKEDKQQALSQAAKQFEAIFMQMLLKSMRSAQEVLESDSPFNSESTKFYRDMHDQQLALELSNNGSLGLSDLIVRQLGGDTENFTPQSLFKSNSFTDMQAKNSELSANSLLNRQIPDSNLTPSAANSAQTNTSTQTNFEHPEDFVNALTAPAKLVEEKLKVPFEVVIAQAALETGWGQKIIQQENGTSSNNLFNIKADNRWSGDKIHKETLEYEQGTMVKKREPFRVYNNLMESAVDYVDFLSTNSRYQGALQQVGNVEQFLHSLQGAGYATDPQYATKIMGTLRRVTSLLSK
ncbi:flagellar assembly peptidoglycan hydrolase FlgJ [Thalassotalea sp. 1_MG-2023]|uniref:flagellar assembly peptidoglycan hydrolase FlgJ n=1 Tax=Thalassotalea sp. 1_MG-2023 TaxID=3062680 RepID=UPI0026E2B656|nr:flagellar assembly peptidoglycan hydrolase FlgJ [Thalassotalea sp. 1_MG-2023]MDO6426439.1 flagellar assembly peptidoglycan hydrolase FlgJ [Thalassotalea sp. 1_MG-2023]